MTILGSFGEQVIPKDDAGWEYLNRVALPLWKKMLAAQNDCECEGGGGANVTFSATEPSDPEAGDIWMEDV